MMKRFIWLDGDTYRHGMEPPANKIVVEVDLPHGVIWTQDWLEHYFDTGQKKVV